MSMADKLAIVMALTGVSPVPGANNQMDMPPPAAVVTIAGQNGGNIRAHVSRVIDYDAAGTRVRVTGTCISACALILALPPDRICVGPGARFGFHQPVKGLTGTMAITDIGDAITDVYPPFVQQWLKSRYGGLPSGKPQIMGYDVLRQHYATCP
ncbi:hypothetical protein D3273_02770 [Lichenibacterium minor]|uniref:Uncharacterized protein n=1 Tax=Lichenibacterium minor TaxID=2316528 RepID=A0A4Q2UF37_9HYPH|nr:hypothetical protein [Lichenibacterium minor]RYC33415.1 hypothetical protein D3273_02770 [Lichenibacterium minor]